MEEQDSIYKGDDGTALRFFKQASKNNFASERAGVPVFDSVLYVEVITPGSNESCPTFELERDFHDSVGIKEPRRSPKYMQYRVQVEAFKANDDTGKMDGTPIDRWPAVDVGIAATLKGLRIYTVEQLAEVPDSTLTRLGTGARQLREQAKAFLLTREFGVPTAKMTAEAETLRGQVERLTASEADLTARLEAALSEVQALKAGSPAPAPVLDPLGALAAPVTALDPLAQPKAAKKTPPSSI